MCYDRRFFKAWATKKAQQRTDEERAVERTPPAQPVTPTVLDRAPVPRKQAEREPEEMV